MAEDSCRLIAAARQLSQWERPEAGIAGEAVPSGFSRDRTANQKDSDTSRYTGK